MNSLPEFIGVTALLKAAKVRPRMISSMFVSKAVYDRYVKPRSPIQTEAGYVGDIAMAIDHCLTMGKEWPGFVSSDGVSTVFTVSSFQTGGLLDNEFVGDDGAIQARLVAVFHMLGVVVKLPKELEVQSE